MGDVMTASPVVPDAPWREHQQQQRPFSARPTFSGPAPVMDRPTSASPRSNWKVEKSVKSPRKPRLDMGTPRGYSAQSLAAKARAPAYGFGSATREQAGKVTGQPERLLGSISPGPAKYHLHASIGGKQPDGRKPDPPVWGFNHAGRFLYGYGKPDKRPGPDEYKMPDSVGGKQPDGRMADPPVWGFGTATREQAGKVTGQPERLLGSISPGPCKYVLPPSVGGQQPDGRRANPPSWSIPSRARAPVDPGLDTPGPVYTIQPVIGPQPDGRFENAPRFGFGTASREDAGKVSY